MEACETHPFSPVGQLGCVLCHGTQLAESDRKRPQAPAKRKRKAAPADDVPDLDEAESILGHPLAGIRRVRVDPSYFE